MVNWVEAQKPLLHWLVHRAGLRQQAIEIEPGTVMCMWVPKHKATNKKAVVPEAAAITKTAFPAAPANAATSASEKPAVVLVHGFATEGIVTWQFQFGALTSQYDVYVPDLFFFGGSTTASADRSPGFQAECLAAALSRLGVERCTAVGFSYGGMVAFKMAERWPSLVTSLVVSGSVFAMTDSIGKATLDQLGFASSSELLMPESIKGLKALLSISMHKKLWFPDFLYRDFLEIMFSNRKERAELLEGLVISNQDAKVPTLDQRILLLWGENDNIFNLELAKKMKEQLGEKATVEIIENAGHLVHVERPCVYNLHLKKFLELVNSEDAKN
ncbi:epoxide hydrolase 4-like [Zingiber officinale]|uniref:epoxide hydrolase 4-like n=1 Tax=Zingiber officinale TaxID=94328 RepID=UPI001C4D1496|nr:epoxide hydrolase 4-like [Zingiber officinale]XP_042385792.1 epoxide hydrolase 4-like [Zingiber officinale]